jgi:hypothetical protein
MNNKQIWLLADCPNKNFSDSNADTIEIALALLALPAIARMQIRFLLKTARIIQNGWQYFSLKVPAGLEKVLLLD